MKESLLSLLLFCSLLGFSQDLDYVRKLVDTLSAPGMHGRGYVNNGDRIAADFIAAEFRKNGLEAINESYLQTFPIAINTFPDTIEVILDNTHLKPGIDFTVLSNSPQVDGTFDLVWRLNDTLPEIFQRASFSDSSYHNKVVVTSLPQRLFYKENPYYSSGLIFINDKQVWWHVSIANQVNKFFALQVSEGAINSLNTRVSVKVNNRFYEDYNTANVIGLLKGSAEVDSFLVVTAHYDHLGRMGSETYFPGSNDNASGVAMMLDLARFYAQPHNKPQYSILFIAFGAEETGLLGSKWFVDHPLVPLMQIRFLINLDMVASGSEGIKVVNATIYQDAFNLLQKLNSTDDLLVAVKKRGPAANSDHFPFHQKGVPSFFIYTLGSECREYHNIYDNPENTPFTAYENFFELLTLFINSF